MLRIVLAAIFVAAIPALADASCGKRPQIDLGGGVTGCIGVKQMIDFTASTEIEDAGAATRRSSVYKVPYVRVEDVSVGHSDRMKRTVAMWSERVCKQFKPEFEADANRWRDPFMVVLFVWGQGEPETGIEKGADGFLRRYVRPDFHYAHMRWNCRVRRQS